MLAIWAFIKVISGGLLKTLQFAAKNWKVVIPAIVIGACLYSWYKADQRADYNYAELVDLQGQYELEVRAQVEKQKALKQFAESSIQAINNHYLEHIKGIENDALKQLGIKNATIAGLRSDLNISLRKQQDALNSHRAREATELDQRFTSGGEVSNTSSTDQYIEGLQSYIGTLETACRFTTVDFNTCRERLDLVCLTIGCEGQ